MNKYIPVNHNDDIDIASRPEAICWYDIENNRLQI